MGSEGHCQTFADAVARCLDLRESSKEWLKS